MATAEPHPAGNRLLILIATLLATFLTAMEATVVSTAMPTIIGELRGLNLYAWVFAAYLLTSTATVPLYGRLADMVGRKPVFVAGIAVFLLGSALSGAAQSMPQLILFRGIQGLGAGAVQPIIFTIVGDLFTLQERARVQGFFSAVWGTSSVAGPALGALITETIGWRWIFYINIPFGIAAVALLAWTLQEQRPAGRHRLDYLGAFTLTSGVTVLLLGLLGSRQGSSINFPLLFAGVALLGLFVAIELRVPEPILPPVLFRSAAIAVPCLAGLVGGIVQYALPSYLPLFVQGVQFGTASDAAKPLGALATAWTVAAFLSPRLLLKVGFRAVAVAGMASLALGTAALLLYRPTTSVWLMMINTALIGLGLGFSSTATLIAAQNAVGWEQRGVVTAAVQFTRTIGGTLGIAILGALLNAQLAPTLQQHGAIDVNSLLDPTARTAIPATALAIIQRALADGLWLVFLLIVITAVFGVIFACFLPNPDPEPAPVRQTTSA